MHITEDTVARLRDRITKGVRIAGSYFQDHRTPFSPTEWHTADDVKFDGEGRLTVTTHYYTEGGARRTLDVYYSAHTMVALAEDDGRNESRLNLPGGYMVACPGGNLRIWDAYAADGTRLARELGTVDARHLLDERAPEMIWVDKGDGKFIARGYGREWLVQRDGRNPDFTAHMPLSRAWLYALLSRPLGTPEYEEVVKGAGTPREARDAAPAPQTH